jgi:hypothetical protein
MEPEKRLTKKKVAEIAKATKQKIGKRKNTFFVEIE